MRGQDRSLEESRMERGQFARPAFAVLVSAGVLLHAAAPAPDAVPPDAETYLKSAGFTPADMQSLAGGQVIARVDSTSDGGEIVTVGAVRIRATREQATSYYGQMISYVDGQVTLAFGRFTRPPILDDVKDLTLDRDELDALQSCKPGDCDLRLGGAGIDAVRRSVDWKAPDAPQQAQAAVRRAAVAYVGAYMERGDDALVTYTNTSKPVSLKEQWRGIVANSNGLQQYAPALRQYLVGYPGATLPGARDVFYWIKENYGLKPVISVVHGVIYQPPDRTDRTIVVQKHIYASHYYDASLAIGALIDGVENNRPITFLVYGNRSRGDMLRGTFGGLTRRAARDQARKATQQTLETIQTVLERAAGVRH
jgi:hypothetical protein